jgi:hypothetical protein
MEMTSWMRSFTHSSGAGAFMASRKQAAKPSAAEQALALAHAALAAALTNPSPRPLFGNAQAFGFFSGTTAVLKAAAHLCEERGWIEPSGEIAGSGKSAKPLYRLTEAGAREAVSRLPASVRSRLRDAVAQIRQGLDALRALEAALAPVEAACREPVEEKAPIPLTRPAPQTQPTTSGSLREVLHCHYEYLCRLVEFQDRLVELPRLYQKARGDIPDLTVRQFQDELLRLRGERQVELYILNEVRSADHPEIGIREGDALYYFVRWKEHP